MSHPWTEAGFLFCAFLLALFTAAVSLSLASPDFRCWVRDFLQFGRSAARASQFWVSMSRSFMSCLTLSL